MPQKFNVLVSEIRAAMIFASNDDARYVLNGVHFEVRRGKAPIMVTTDGRRLAVIESEAMQEDGVTLSPEEFTVSCDFLKPLCQFAKSQAATVTVEFHAPHRIIFSMMESHCVVDSERGAMVEGTFPSWRGIVPVGEKLPVQQLGINAEFVGDFAKAAKTLGSDIAKDAACEVHISGKPNFYAIIMPVRPEEKDKWQPEFLGMDKFTNPKPLPPQD